jgi:hypothetical protein
MTLPLIVIPETPKALSGTAQDERLHLGGPGSPARWRGLAAGMTAIEFDRAYQKPFPLKGGRVGMGVYPRGYPSKIGEGPPLSLSRPQRLGTHPQPCPSPLEGEGFIGLASGEIAP